MTLQVLLRRHHTQQPPLNTVGEQVQRTIRAAAYITNTLLELFK